MNLLAELKSRLAGALSGLVEDASQFSDMIRPATDPKFGDYQANLAMPLSKHLKQDSRSVASLIVSRWKLDDLCETPEIAGPGFINLRLKSDWLTAQLEQMLRDDRLAVPPVRQPKNIIIDYSSPNVAKPMHVGHLRSTVIGDALYHILKFQGHSVTSDNHLGDWGTQFGMIIYGYKHFRDDAAYAQSPVTELSRLYRLVNQLCDYHESRAELPGTQQNLDQVTSFLEPLNAAGKQLPKEQEPQRKKLRDEQAALRDQLASLQKKVAVVEQTPDLLSLAQSHPNILRATREETAQLHAGNPENLTLWQEFMPCCLAALDRVYQRLNIRFDLTLGESHYQPFLTSVVSSLTQKGLAVDSDSAKCVFLAGARAPFIIQKADGAFTYATTDLATIRDRVERLHADTILYVVDNRQSDHFLMLFDTARRWGFDRVDLRHISFGTVLGEDKRPYKTRSGDTVGLESLLDEAVTEARKILETSPEARDADPALWQSIAESVGLGGIKYADLRHNRESDYVFSWQKMLAKEGDTATYLQYAYARTAGIFRKENLAREDLRSRPQPFSLDHPAERKLALQLVRLHETLDATTTDYRPNILTQYLFETASQLNPFYDACPVLKAETPQLRTSRLQLCEITGRLLKLGLNLLGIQAIERM